MTMMTLFGDPAVWLPFTFAALMGLSILIYVVLDGFDLGVGLLFPFADDAEKDRMVASIGPFWDANETWLVLAIGILLVAFPMAHGEILTALYLPVAIMLIGLILRGVAFEFRVKAPRQYKRLWNRALLRRQPDDLAVPGLHARPLHHGPRMDAPRTWPSRCSRRCSSPWATASSARPG